MDAWARLCGALRGDAYQGVFRTVYGDGAAGAADRYQRVALAYRERFGMPEDLRFYSAPGRAEILGNHTDHNHGRVLAAAVTLDTVAAASPSRDGVIRLISDGYGELTVDTGAPDPRPDEAGTSAAIVRGVAARLARMGRDIGGFTAAVSSSVGSGSGLSSSAAFEVLIVTILSDLYAGPLTGLETARIAQYAENAYFGKPCGLMDQTASAMGGLVAIDFAGAEPEVTALSYDFAAQGYDVVVASPGGSHDHLTAEYAAIPDEMRSVAAALGGGVLRDIAPGALMARLGDLRGRVSDRALLRALHFFDENLRVEAAVGALRAGDTDGFLRCVIASGESSWRLLQNAYVGGSPDQPLALALALAEHRLRGRGGWRIHGGGFAGTILAFVPKAYTADLTAEFAKTFGPSACAVLGIRPLGAVRVDRAGM